MDAPPTTSVHRGTPPQGYREWATTKVHVHGFADLSAERNVPVDSPEFIALGNPWRLRLYPGGRYDSEMGWVSIILFNQSNESIDMNFGFSINDGNGKQTVSMQTHVTFDPVDGVDGPLCGLGWRDFAKRSTLIDSLFDGTLVVEVHMQPIEPIIAALPQFIPENPFNKNILQLLNDEESSDVVFAVGEHQSKDNAKKVAKIAPVTLHAHSLILTACSAVLAELCESKGDPSTPIEITDVSPEVFRHLLYYIYGGKIDVDDMKSHAKDIINAANRYGVATLKLEAEAFLVEGTTFTLENVMEHLIYADSMNCALLKEAAMDYIVANKDEVMSKISFDEMIPGNLMRDLLAAVVRGERGDNRAVGGSGENEYNTMRISELRNKAYEKGLDVDGSREMLIAVLKENS